MFYAFHFLVSSLEYELCLSPLQSNTSRGCAMMEVGKVSGEKKILRLSIA